MTMVILMSSEFPWNLPGNNAAGYGYPLGSAGKRVSSPTIQHPPTASVVLHGLPRNLARCFQNYLIGCFVWTRLPAISDGPFPVQVNDGC